MNECLRAAGDIRAGRDILAGAIAGDTHFGLRPCSYGAPA